MSALSILTLLGVRSRAQVWLIDAAMLAYGIEATLIDPAEDALFAEMLPAAQRRRVNGWRLGIQETGRLVAPLLGAALFTALGGGPVAGLDAATFLVAAAAAGRLRLAPATPPAVPALPALPAGSAPPAPAAPPPARWWRELTAGAAHIRATAELRPVAIAATVAMAISGVGVAAQYSLVTAVGQRPAFLGVLSALLGAGSIVAALGAGRLVARIGERRLAVLGLVNFAAGTALRATGALAPALAGTALLGFALPWLFLAAVNLYQRLTPLGLQGRVSAAMTLALFGPQAPVQALGALLIVHVSYRAIYATTAVVVLAVAAWLARPAGVSRSGTPGCARRGER